MGGVTIGWAPSAHAQDLSFYDEVFFSLRYDRTVDAIVNALYDGEEFYLSLQDVFEPLQLDVALDMPNQVASGFYIDEDRRYEIRFGEGRARIGKRTVFFDSTGFVQAPLGFFLRPALMDSIFGFSTNVDLRSLSIGIASSEPLPVDLAAERASSRRFLGPMEVFEDAPLLFDRKRALLRGGVIGYSLSANSINDTQLYRLDVLGGLEILGGDLQGNMQTILTENEASFDYSNVQWRFVPRSDRLLSQVKAGEVSSNGLRTFRYRGAQFSNAPVQIQRVFGYQRFEGQTEPGWEVELLVNNRLVDFTTADATGHYAFAIPISYGTTLTTIRMYGPNGQFEETERRLQVPFSFVPVGKLFYDLDVGQTLDQDRAIAQFGASLGVSSWLTTSIGAEYVGAGGVNAEDARFQPIGELTARLLHHHLVSVEVAPGALYRGSINAFYPSLATFTVRYTRFSGTNLYNQSNRDQIIEVQSSFPIQVGAIPINFRVNGRRNTFRQQHAYTLRPGFSAQFVRGLRVNATYQLGATDSPDQPLIFGTAFLNGGINYAVSRQARAPAVLQGILASMRFGYDTRSRQLNSTALSLSRNVGTFGRIRVGTTYNVTSKNFLTDVQFSLNLPSARTTTTVRGGGGNTSFSQDITGSIGWDGAHAELVLDEQNWVGSSAASVRMFVDVNGNDTFDKGEHVIEDGDLRFRQALNVQRSPSGVGRVHNLRAYDQYSVTIDKTSIRNPLWVPKVDSFSFVADPNSFKQLDIPFYVSGIIEGSVLQERNNGLVPIPGMRVHVWSADRSEHRVLPVFRDGQFFEMELRPGDYVAVVDSTQLGVLGVTSDPPIHPFTVQVTEDGDWVSGLDFVLRRTVVEPPPEESVPPDEDLASPDPALPDVVSTADSLARSSAQDDTPEPPEPASDVLQNPLPSGSSTQTESSGAQNVVPVDSLEQQTHLEFREGQAESEALPPEAEPSPSDPTIGQSETSESESIASNPQERFYVVEPNEISLVNIARKAYGDASRWREIWEANKDQLPDPNVITAGQVLRLPGTEDIVQDASVDASQSSEQSTTPPEPTPQAGTYVVQQGDKGLMDIARKVYQDGNLWVKIWVANQGALDAPHLIVVGQRLVIPAKAPLTNEERQAQARLLNDG